MIYDEKELTDDIGFNDRITEGVKSKDNISEEIARNNNIIIIKLNKPINVSWE